MILYTTMPLELVWEGSQNEPVPLVEVQILEATVQIMPTAPGMGRIVRLISAPLSYYLRPEFSPGQFIYYYPPSEPVNVPKTPEFKG